MRAPRTATRPSRLTLLLLPLTVVCLYSTCVHAQEESIDESRLPAVGNLSFYDTFWTLPYLEQRWLDIAEKYPSIVKHERIGKSIEGRDIIALRVGNTSSTEPRRVLFNALIHANEWISYMVATYIAERLAIDTVEDPDSATAKLLSDVQVLVLPMCNPDGYVYSMDFHREWRKNRRPNICTEGTPGVDINRNFPVDFGGNYTGKANDTCSLQYPGTEPFSEPETVALRDYVLNNPGIRSHLDLNSYLQVIVGPWLYTEGTPPRAEEADKLGKDIARAMTAADVQNYRYGRAGIEKLIGLASGIFTDWTYSRGIFAYHVALRPTADSKDRYDLPADQIEPTCREGLAAAIVTMEHARDALAGTPTPLPTQGAVKDASASSTGANEKSAEGKKNRTTIIIVGSVVGVAVAVIIVAVVLVFVVRKKDKGPDDEFLTLNSQDVGNRMVDDGMEAAVR